MAFVKAVKHKSKLRCAITGTAGSGKTKGALLIAKGLGGQTALIDTENGSASLYSDDFDFLVQEIKPPFKPEKYIAAIKEAESAGIDVLVIDSLSHAWAGSGGILEMLDEKTRGSAKGNSFIAWKDVTPIQNRLIDTILQSNMHIIVTMRTKTHYDIETTVDDRTGKTTSKPVKRGLAPIQRADLEYEFTLVLEINQNHYAFSSKDRTQLFKDDSFIITEETGKILNDWLNSGADIKKEVEKPAITTTNTPDEVVIELIGYVKEAKDKGIMQDKDVQFILDKEKIEDLAEMTTIRAKKWVGFISGRIKNHETEKLMQEDLSKNNLAEAAKLLEEGFDAKVLSVDSEPEKEEVSNGL